MGRVVFHEQRRADGLGRRSEILIDLMIILSNRARVQCAKPVM